MWLLLAWLELAGLAAASCKTAYTRPHSCLQARLVAALQQLLLLLLSRMLQPAPVGLLLRPLQLEQLLSLPRHGTSSSKEAQCLHPCCMGLQHRQQKQQQQQQHPCAGAAAACLGLFCQQSGPTMTRQCGQQL
jgi:hypothetical protein